MEAASKSCAKLRCLKVIVNSSVSVCITFRDVVSFLAYFSRREREPMDCWTPVHLGNYYYVQHMAQVVLLSIENFTRILEGTVSLVTLSKERMLGCGAVPAEKGSKFPSGLARVNFPDCDPFESPVHHFLFVLSIVLHIFGVKFVMFRLKVCSLCIGENALEYLSHRF